MNEGMETVCGRCAFVAGCPVAANETQNTQSGGEVCVGRLTAIYSGSIGIDMENAKAALAATAAEALSHPDARLRLAYAANLAHQAMRASSQGDAQA